MCTVSYFPKNDTAIVTANRDEAPARNSDGLSVHCNDEGTEFLIAKEPLHGSTNLAIGKGYTTVLLNGAFLPHIRKPSYLKSRGFIVLESLNLASLDKISKDYLEGVEPFTLLRFGDHLEEVRWDEYKVHFRTHDPKKPLLVASAKLYSRKALENRQKWFDELLGSDSIDSQSLWDFHVNGGDGDPENDMVMNRYGIVRTVSVSQVASSRTRNLVKHFDLIKKKTDKLTLEK